MPSNKQLGTDFLRVLVLVDRSLLLLNGCIFLKRSGTNLGLLQLQISLLCAGALMLPRAEAAFLNDVWQPLTNYQHLPRSA